MTTTATSIRATPLGARLRRIQNNSIALSVLAIVVALVVGAILIAFTNPAVIAALGYFFTQPGDTFVAIGNAVGGAYGALIQGGIYDFSADSFVDGIKPLFDSLGFATPLALAGLGIAVAFRTGLFNIGGQGQMVIAGACAGWVGFALPLPPGIHLIVALLAGIAGGAIWAGIAGVLKAKTGAHEVIVTIMLNYIAFYLVDYLLQTPVLRAPGTNNPKSPAELPTAVLPLLLGSSYSLNLGLILAIVAVVAVAWLMSRSSLGFRLRAVGLNRNASRVAGMQVERLSVWAMLISGGLVGLAGTYQVLGQTTTGFSSGFDAGIGFSAITVALLGRSRPWGVFAAAILFGILTAGGYRMQASQGVPVDVISVIQAVVVLLVAAPPLIRSIFRIRVSAPIGRMPEPQNRPEGSTR